MSLDLGQIYQMLQLKLDSLYQRKTQGGRAGGWPCLPHTVLYQMGFWQYACQCCVAGGRGHYPALIVRGPFKTGTMDQDGVAC